MRYLISCVEALPDGSRKRHTGRITIYRLDDVLPHTEAHFRRELPGAELSEFEALPLPYARD